MYENEIKAVPRKGWKLTVIHIKPTQGQNPLCYPWRACSFATLLSLVLLKHISYYQQETFAQRPLCFHLSYRILSIFSLTQESNSSYPSLSFSTSWAAFSRESWFSIYLTNILRDSHFTSLNSITALDSLSSILQKLTGFERKYFVCYLSGKLCKSHLIRRWIGLGKWCLYPSTYPLSTLSAFLKPHALYRSQYRTRKRHSMPLEVWFSSSQTVEGLGRVHKWKFP